MESDLFKDDTYAVRGIDIGRHDGEKWLYEYMRLSILHRECTALDNVVSPAIASHLTQKIANLSTLSSPAAP